MRWLLDSNAWIHYLNNPNSPVDLHLAERSPEEVHVCSVVKAELFHGARKHWPRVARRIERALTSGRA